MAEQMRVDQTMAPPVGTVTDTIGGRSPVAPGGGLHPGVGRSVAGGAELSSSGKRLGAYLLDGVLSVVTLGMGWLIWSLVIWSKGQTPAKQLMGMRVVRTDTGAAATFGTMALRELVGKGVLSSLTFGLTTFISCFMVFGAARQGIWDKIANTIVVDDPDGRLAPR